MAGNKDVIINYKLNGVDQASSSIDTLNSKLEKNNQLAGNMSQSLVDANGKLIQSTNSASKSLDDSSKSMSNLKDNAQKTNSNLNNLKVSSDGISSNLNKGAQSGERFGNALAKSTTEAARGLNGIANVLQVVGLQNEQLQKLSIVIRSIGELLRLHATLTSKAFENSGILAQSKALAGLNTVKKVDVALTEEQITSNEAATTAQLELNAAQEASPWGLIAVAIGLVIAGLLLFNDETEKAIKQQEDFDDSMLKVNDQFRERSKLIGEAVSGAIQNEISALNTELDILILQKGNLEDQEKIRLRIIRKKEEEAQNDLQTQRKVAVSISNDIQDLEDKLLLSQKRLREKETGFVQSLFGGFVNFDNSDLQKVIDDLVLQIQKKEDELASANSKGLNSKKKAKQDADDEAKRVKLETQNAIREREIQRRKELEDALNSAKELELQLQKIKNESYDAFFKSLNENDKQQVSDSMFIIKQLITQGKDASDEIRDIITQSYEDIFKIYYQDFNLFKSNEELKRDEILQTLKLTKQSNDDKFNRQLIENGFSNKDLSKNIDALDNFLTKQKEAFDSGKKINVDNYNFLVDLREKYYKNIRLLDEKISTTSSNAEANISERLKQTSSNILDGLIKEFPAKEEELRKLYSSIFESFADKFENLSILDPEKYHKDVNKIINDIIQQFNEKAKEIIIPVKFQLQEKPKEISTGDFRVREDENNTTPFIKVPVDTPIPQRIGPGGSRQNMLALDADFKKFEESLSQVRKKEFNEVDALFEDVYNSIAAKQVELQELIKKGSLLSLPKIISEGKKEIELIRQVSEQQIRFLKEKKQEQIDAVKSNNALSPDEQKAEIDIINKEFDTKISNIKSSLKNLTDNFDKAVKDIIINATRVLEQFQNIAISVADALNGLYDSQGDLRKAQLDKEIQQLEDAQTAKEQIIQDSNTRISELEGQLNSARGNRHAYLLGLIATEQRHLKQAQKEKEQLLEREKKDKQEEKQIEHDATKRKLELDRAQTISAGALAEIRAIASLVDLTGFGLALGIAEAASIAAITAIHVGTIDNELKANDAQLGEGGLLSGPSHLLGGIPVGNTGISVEGDEFVVNKKATQNNFQAVSMLNAMGANTKFDLVPSTRAFTKTMADGGALPDFSKLEVSSNDITNQELLNAISKLQIFTSIKEVNDGQANFTRIRDIAKV